MSLQVDFEDPEPPRPSLRLAGLLGELVEQAHTELMAERAAAVVEPERAAA